MSEEQQNIQIVIEKKSNGLAIASLVLGIVAIVFSLIPLVNVISIILGFIGLGLGIGALVNYVNKKNTSFGLTIAGLILSALSVIFFFTVNEAFINFVNNSLGL